MIYTLVSSESAFLDLEKRIPKPRKIFVIEDDTDLSPFFIAEEAKAVLVSGAKLLKRVGEEGYVPKGRAIASMRHREHVIGAVPWFFTHDPYMAANDSNLNMELEVDIKLVERRVLTGTVKPIIGEYDFVFNFNAEVAYIQSQWDDTQQPCQMSVDLETMGLDCYNPGADIVSVSITLLENSANIVYIKDLNKDGLRYLIKQLIWLLNTPKVRVVGANFKYDLNWLWEKWKVTCSNFTMDTTLVGSLLDENVSNSLNTHAKRYTTMGGYDDVFNQIYDKGHMELVPREDLKSYAGGDTDATFKVANIFRGMFSKDKALSRFYVKLLHPAVRAFEKVEQEGILIDLPYFFSLQQELRDTIAILEERALSWVSTHIKNKYHGIDAKGLPNLRLSKASVIKDIMFEHPKGLKLKPYMVTPKNQEPSTAMEHLFMFQDHPQAKVFIDALKEYGSAQKTLGTYVDGFLVHLKADGRFHPNFQFFKGDWGGDHDSGTVCVTADTLFLTDRGHVSTLNVSVGQKVISHTGKVQVVTDFIYNGIQQIYKVTTGGGLSLRTNALHPYLLSDGSWVEACELRVGDEVVVYGSAEKWGKLPEWPYEVSTWGRVRNSKGKILKPQAKGAWGHLKVSLSRDSNQRIKGDMKDFAVHRLVAAVWLPVGGGGKVLRHINGIAFDNHYLNLAWGTQLENKQDDVLYGTSSKVGGCQAKLNWARVEYIRSSPLNDAEVSKTLGVSRELVRDVRLGKRWIKRDITEKIVKFKVDKIISVELDGVEDTFGVSVSEDNSHVTNGIVTHNTGRASAVNPAVQTVPKNTAWAKRLRKGYIAPSKFLVLNWDFSQGELRIAADISNEPTMLKLYAAGYDQHMVTGGAMLGYSISDMLEMETADPDRFKEIRQNGKAGNFGLLYGMAAKGFQTYARVTYGVILTLEEAEDKRNRFFTLYSRLPDWHNEQKFMAKKYGYVRSPLGRVRHLPMIYSKDNEIRSKAERQAINSPVQATLSDMTIYALAKFREKYGDPDTCRIHCFSHDALTGYVHMDQVTEWGPAVKEVMETLPLRSEFGWDHKVKFIADCEVGDSWGTLEKYPLWLQKQNQMVHFVK